MAGRWIFSWINGLLAKKRRVIMGAMKDKLQIAISGKSGSGNTTVSGLLAKRLGVTLINYTFRQLAAERNMTLPQVIEAAKSSDEYDRYVDTKQVALAKSCACVLGSRLAVWMLDTADLRVYLKASEEVRVRRIIEREGGDFGSVQKFTRMRDSEDTRRYLALYNIDNNDTSKCDLVINTEQLPPPQIVSLIIDELHKRGLV